MTKFSTAQCFPQKRLCHIEPRRSKVRFAPTFFCKKCHPVRSLAPPLQTGPASLVSGLGSGADLETTSFLALQSKTNGPARSEQIADNRSDRAGPFFLLFLRITQGSSFGAAARVSFRQCSLSAHADWVTGTQARNFCSVLIKIIPTAKPSAAGTTHPSP